MYQVFRINRGHNLHVIHETLTKSNRTHNVYTLCRADPASGERDKGPATCSECLDLDNPCNFTPAEMNFLSRLIIGDSSLSFGHPDSRAIRMLRKRDLIAGDPWVLTRRGKILALDWSLGPAPAASVRGVVHARQPLSNSPKCGTCGVLDGFEAMSVDRYAKIRALDLHVTCIQCLHAPH